MYIEALYEDEKTSSWKDMSLCASAVLPDR